jgi:glycosyltransferase involved in cell wall biosynthesis
VLIDAAAEVVRRHPSVGFVIFGEGSQRAELQRQIDRAGLTRHCVLAGFRADLDCYVTHLDLMVLPSHTEGLPNVVLEACAAGVPVLATAVGGSPEVIDDGNTGYLVPPARPDLLAARLIDALADREQLRAVGRHGRERVLASFGFAAQAEEYLELFEELTACPTNGSAREPVCAEVICKR